MGERAQRGYDEAEREAIRALPWQQRRIQALVATLVVVGLAAFFITYAVQSVWAETVDVKYRGPVDLGHFECTCELDSSLVKRVCYNTANQYMLISLKGTGTTTAR